MALDAPGKAARLAAAKQAPRKEKPPLVNVEYEELLLQALPARWDPATRTLNLAALVQDPALAVKPVSGGLCNLGFVNSLLAVIRSRFGNAVAVDLSNNGITALQVRPCGWRADKYAIVSLITVCVWCFVAFDDGGVFFVNFLPCGNSGP